VLVVDADCSLAGLLDEWLGSVGCQVSHHAGRSAEEGETYDLVIVDVPFPRQGGVDLISRLTRRHPTTPILALSSTFFAGIDCCGPVARGLGVACVLPSPASREALIGAVRRFLPI
jgi:CheY-like chemotaxis protein